LSRTTAVAASAFEDVVVVVVVDVDVDVDVVAESHREVDDIHEAEEAEEAEEVEEVERAERAESELDPTKIATAEGDVVDESVDDALVELTAGAESAEFGVAGLSEGDAPSGTGAMSDEELLAGIRSQSEAHFAELYHRYFQRIYSFVYTRMRNHAET